MFSMDNKAMQIMVVIFIVMGLSSYMNNPDALFELLLTLPGVLLAITFHEFAHAYAADKLGDDTPRMQGRLNLNPLSHLDPIGTVLLIFAGFGWGKPVQINPRNFDRKISMQKGEAIVSVAGPLMNFILAFIIAIILSLLLSFMPQLSLNEVGIVVLSMVHYTLKVNIGLGVFNLIPLPPLDGSKILMSIVPYKVRYWIIQNEHIFSIIFLVVWITGIAGVIISPVINAIYSGMIWTITSVLAMF